MDAPRSAKLPVLALILSLVGTTIAGWLLDTDAWLPVPLEITQSWLKLTNGDLSLTVFQNFLTLFTSALFHGDLFHLLGNLLFIWIFGMAVCQIVGWRWLLTIFILGAIGGSVIQNLLDPYSSIPSLGASGALMAFEGAYLSLCILRPRPDVHIWPIASPIAPLQLAMAGVIGISLDFMGMNEGLQGIAYGAHIGGFVTGIFLGIIRRG